MLKQITENIPEIKVFPEKILQDNSLLDLVPAAIYAIQKEWIELEKANVELGNPFNMSLYEILKKPFQKQKEVLEDLAKRVFFLKSSVKYEKKCGEKGHTIRINDKKLNLEDAIKLIKQMKLLYERDPTILQVHCYERQIPRRPQKYDVRVDFRHVENCPNCSYLPIKVERVEKISVFDVLELFKASVEKNGFDIDEQYKRLIHLTFRVGVCLDSYTQGFIRDIFNRARQIK